VLLGTVWQSQLRSASAAAVPAASLPLQTVSACPCLLPLCMLPARLQTPRRCRPWRPRWLAHRSPNKSRSLWTQSESTLTPPVSRRLRLRVHSSLLLPLSALSPASSGLRSPPPMPSSTWQLQRAHRQPRQQPQSAWLPHAHHRSGIARRTARLMSNTDSSTPRCR